MLNPDTARLSDASIFQLKKHKVEHCVAQLKMIGLTNHEAQDAAKLMGGDLENASDWHIDSMCPCSHTCPSLIMGVCCLPFLQVASLEICVLLIGTLTGCARDLCQHCSS